MQPPQEARLPGGEIERDPLEMTPQRWYWVTDPEPKDFRIDRSELAWLDPHHAAIGYGGWYLLLRNEDGLAVARSGPWPNEPKALAEAVREMFPARRDADRRTLATLEEQGGVLIEDALTARLVATARELARAVLPKAGEKTPAALITDVQEAANARQAWLGGQVA